MRNSWARAFLERFDEFLEDDFEMGDKLFYQRQWNDKARAAAHRAITKALEAQEHDSERALSDTFYGEQLLSDNGICPSCLYPRQHCECKKDRRDDA